MHKLVLFTKIYEAVSQGKPLDVVVYAGAVKNPNATIHNLDIEYFITECDSKKRTRIIQKKGETKSPYFTPDVAEEGLLKQINAIKGEIEDIYKADNGALNVTIVTAGELALRANNTKADLSKEYADGLSEIIKHLGYDKFINVKDIGTFYAGKKEDIAKYEKEIEAETERWLNDLKNDKTVLKNGKTPFEDEIEHARKNIYDEKYRQDGAEVDLEKAVKEYKRLHILDDKIDVLDELESTIRFSLLNGNNESNGRLGIWPVGTDGVVATPWQGIGIKWIDEKGKERYDVLTPERLAKGYIVKGEVVAVGGDIIKHSFCWDRCMSVKQPIKIE